MTRQRLIFVHHLMLEPPATPMLKPSRGFTLISEGPLVDRDRVLAIAASYGCKITVDTVEEQISDTPDDVMCAQVDFECRSLLGLAPEEKPEPNDARLNDLEHSLRNQGRAINQLTDVISQLGAAVRELVQAPRGFTTFGYAGGGGGVGGAPQGVTIMSTPGGANSLPQRIEYAPAGMPTVSVPPPAMLPVPNTEPLTEKQASAGRFPLVGTPAPFTGDQTVPVNPHARGAGQTGEMASGMLSTIGPGASTKIVVPTGDVDDKGQPVMRELPLPKVGNTLFPNRGT